MEFSKLWLIIERIDMSHPAGHVQPDDAFGFGFEMRRLDNTRPLGNFLLRRSRLLRQH